MPGGGSPPSPGGGSGDPTGEVVAVDTSRYVAGLDAGPASLVESRRPTDWVTRALIAVLIWSVGFLAGSRLQSVLGSLGTGPGSAADSGAEEAPPAAGSDEASTVGTIKVVDGGLLYVIDDAGTVVKVQTSAGSVITSSAPAVLGDLRPGDDVVVRGRRLPDGTVAADSVAEVGG